MARAKIAVTIDENALTEIDRLVDEGVFANRSKALEAAVLEQLRRVRQSRLAVESAKLDREEEQAMADEGYAGEGGWPEY